MAVPNIVVDTTFSGKDITSAASVYEFTAALTGTYRIQVRLAAVAGNGDYIAYLALNDGDALTDDPMLPKTTITAAAGETAFWFQTISIDLIAGDVVNVMVDGLAGDNNEAGSIRIFSDAALQPTTAGRTLDVAAGGEAGLDFANVNGTPPNSAGVTTMVADYARRTGDYSTYAGTDTPGTTTLLGQLAGITSLANWLRGVFRKDAMNAAAKLEVNAGGGTFNETTDSLEAQLDSRPAAAPAMITTQEVRDAMKLAPTAGAPVAGSVDAHLDTAIADTGNLLARLGAFTGTGINTVLGFMRAIMRKDAALTPSDVGGTFDNTTDSEEAVSEAVATLAPGGAIVLNSDITEIHTT